MNDYQKFIAISRYARWIDEENRRETWEETVQRYVDYITEKVKGHLPKKQIIDAITKLEVMPSMRALMTAGSALERDNTAGYNCSYLPVDDPKAFDEAMYILLCGTGVGFSVERQYVSQLPEIPQGFEEVDTCIQVQDSKEGWAKALRKLIGHLYMGEVPIWDMSKKRESFARPEPKILVRQRMTTQKLIQAKKTTLGRKVKRSSGPALCAVEPALTRLPGMSTTRSSMVTSFSPICALRSLFRASVDGCG